MPELKPTESDRLNAEIVILRARVERAEGAIANLTKRLTNQESTNEIQQKLLRQLATSASRKSDRTLILTAALGGLVLALMIGIQVQEGVLSYALPSEAVVAVTGAIASALVIWYQKDKKNE